MPNPGLDPGLENKTGMRNAEWWPGPALSGRMKLVNSTQGQILSPALVSAATSPSG